MSDEPVAEIRSHDQVIHVVVCKRSLDDESTRALVDIIQSAAAGRPVMPIVLDLSRVKFAPSVALGELVKMNKSFSFDGRRIVLVGVDGRVRQALRVTSLDRVLEIRDSLEQVVQAL